MKTSTQNTDDFDLIERFFDFALSETELQQFEQRMETDASFKKRFQLFKEMDTHIEINLGASEEIELIKKKFKAESPVNRTIKPVANNKGARIFTMRRVLSIAAAVTLVIASIVTMRTILQPTNTAVLAMDYWKNSNKVNFNNLRSDTDLTIVEQQLITASELFDQQNYAESIQQLTSISTSDKLYPKAALLLGQTYFQQNNKVNAIQQFQNVLDHPSGEYKSIALWYQALAYLANGNTIACQENLNIIIEQNYPIAPKAKELLSQIK